MGTRGTGSYELPLSARLAHDLLWARRTLTGTRPRLGDLEEADRLAALLIARWTPHRTGAHGTGPRRLRWLRRT
jgi:hypothetical protein